MSEKSIHICSDNKTILYVTYFEYLNTVDERFAYALNRIEKKIAKATTSPQEKCVMMCYNSMLAVQSCANVLQRYSDDLCI